MRIIAGEFRGRQLRSMPGADLRPTSDKLRETLFNVLTAGNPEALNASRWLDLYAGTGAVGIEALSRGAHSVVFVENSTKHAALIEGNLKSLGIVEGTEIVRSETEKALKKLGSQAAEFDFCFLDPPYRLHNEYQDTLSLIAQLQILSRSALVIAEHDKRYDPGEAHGSLQRFRTLKQGDATLSFYRIA